MDQNETPEETKTSTLDTVKKTGELLVLTYAVTTAAVGFYGLAKEAKAALKEKRQAKKDQQENEES